MDSADKAFLDFDYGTDDDDPVHFQILDQTPTSSLASHAAFPGSRFGQQSKGKPTGPAAKKVKKKKKPKPKMVESNIQTDDIGRKPSESEYVGSEGGSEDEESDEEYEVGSDEIERVLGEQGAEDTNEDLEYLAPDSQSQSKS